MSRDAAIEAGAWAAALWLEDDWDEMDPEDQEKTREYAAAVIDAALPHLVGEPVGWAVVLNPHERDPHRPDIFRTHDAARDLAAALRLSGETPTVVALVPVIEP